MTELDRRALFRLGGRTALGVAAAAALAACGDRGGLRAGAPTSTFVPARPVDPSKPWWLRGNFAPVTQEVEARDLAIAGRIPAELSGLYVRNGSNPKSGWAPHWFLGDGMVHGVVPAGGKECRPHVPVAVPRGFAVGEYDPVHHSVAEEPVRRRNGARGRTRRRQSHVV